jgi:hypothetical protein
MKLQTLIMILVLSSATIAQDLLARYPKTEKYETKCEICGAPIVEYREIKDSFDNGFTLTNNPFFQTNSPLYKLSFNQTIEICKDCAEAYQDRFNKKMLRLWIDLLRDAKSDNEPKRKNFELQAKRQKETEIKNKIEELQDDLRELNGEPRKKKINTLKLNSCITDSISTKNILTY